MRVPPRVVLRLPKSFAPAYLDAPSWHARTWTGLQRCGTRARGDLHIACSASASLNTLRTSSKPSARRWGPHGPYPSSGQFARAPPDARSDRRGRWRAWRVTVATVERAGAPQWLTL